MQSEKYKESDYNKTSKIPCIMTFYQKHKRNDHCMNIKCTENLT